MKTYRMKTRSGVVTATDAMPVRFTEPAWLRAYEFFVSRAVKTNGEPLVLFTISEVTTGYGLGGCYGKTRMRSAKLAKWYLTLVGAERVAEVMAKTPKLSDR